MYPQIAVVQAGKGFITFKEWPQTKLAYVKKLDRFCLEVTEIWQKKQ